MGWITYSFFLASMGWIAPSFFCIMWTFTLVLGKKALWLKGQKAPWLKMSGKPQWAGKGKGWQPHGAQKGGGGQIWMTTCEPCGNGGSLV